MEQRLPVGGGPGMKDFLRSQKLLPLLCQKDFPILLNRPVDLPALFQKFPQLADPSFQGGQIPGGCVPIFFRLFQRLLQSLPFCLKAPDLLFRLLPALPCQPGFQPLRLLPGQEAPAFRFCPFLLPLADLFLCPSFSRSFSGIRVLSSFFLASFVSSS